MTAGPLLLPFAIGLLALVGIFVQIRLRRNSLRRRFEVAWGVARPPARHDGGRLSEAWDASADEDTRDGAIDDRTWDDLGLSDVLETLDRTRTGLGRQRLYGHLRASADLGADSPLEEMAGLFGRDPAARRNAALQLGLAGDRLGYGLWHITRPGAIPIRWWYWTFPVLALGVIGCAVAIPFYPRALIGVVALMAVNMAVRAATAWQLPGLLLPMRQIGPIIRTAKRLVRGRGLSECLSAKRIAADVRTLKRLKRIAGWVSRDPAVVGEIVASLYEYLNLLLLLDANALLFGARRLRRSGPALARVATWIGDVDVALNVASLRAEPRAWCVPDRTGAGETRITGAWHVLIEAPVPNDAELRSGKGVIVTGANMSGKSTYLRTIGVAAVLARSLNTVPAVSWNGAGFRVRSLIGRADDLSAGKSYYQVEAEGVVELLRRTRTDPPTLFLLDELLRGTNTTERLAAGEAVLRELLAGGDAGASHTVVVATHDGELVSMLADFYQPWHFRESIGPDGLSFEYQRLPGPATSRTAIALLEATGAPAEVVRFARRRAEEIDGPSS